MSVQTMVFTQQHLDYINAQMNKQLSGLAGPPKIWNSVPNFLGAPSGRMLSCRRGPIDVTQRLLDQITKRMCKLITASDTGDEPMSEVMAALTKLTAVDVSDAIAHPTHYRLKAVYAVQQEELDEDSSD